MSSRFSLRWSARVAYFRFAEVGITLTTSTGRLREAREAFLLRGNKHSESVPRWNVQRIDLERQADSHAADRVL